MGQIYLVRHGQASFGAADYDELSDLGREQSRLLGGWLAACGRPITGVVTGSLRRHHQTAEACLSAIPDGLKPNGEWTADSGFDEYDHNLILARYSAEFADPEAGRRVLERSENPKRAFQEAFAQAMVRWMSGGHSGEYAESWVQFRQRCVGALERLAGAAGASRTTVVFTSGGPIAAICQELLGIPDRNAVTLNWSMVNSAVTKLLHQPGRISLSYLNAFPHLERTGRPQDITYR